LDPSQPPIEPIVRSIEPIARSIDSIPPAISPLVRPQDTIMHFQGAERNRESSTEVMSRFKSEVKRVTVVGKNVRGSIGASSNLGPNDGASVSDYNRPQVYTDPYNPISNRVITISQTVDQPNVVRRYTSPQPAPTSYNLVGNQGFGSLTPNQQTQTVVSGRWTQVHPAPSTDNTGVQIRRSPLQNSFDNPNQDLSFRIVGHPPAFPNAPK
jgi:hypothetical protein